MSLGVVLALILEVLRLINRAGGAKAALATVKQVNDTFDQLKAAKDPLEKQDAAQAISNLLSGS